MDKVVFVKTEPVLCQHRVLGEISIVGKLVSQSFGTVGWRAVVIHGKNKHQNGFEINLVDLGNITINRESIEAL